MKCEVKSFRTLLLSALLLIIPLVIYAEDPPKNVDITKGNGSSGRSKEYNCQLSVSFDMSNLYIRCDYMNLDCIVELYDGLICALKEYIPIGISSAVIPISHLERGKVYHLEVFSQQGEQWTGTFLYE